MPMLNFHPAPGLGDLPPGWFDLPQNPLRPDSTALVPTVRAAVGNRVTRKPTIGELLPGTAFTVPQNPIEKQLGTGRMGDLVPGAHFTVPQDPIHGMSGMGCGCGCDGGSAPAVALAGFMADSLVNVPGETPYLYDFPTQGDNPAVWYQPPCYYGQPSSEDMQTYGMGALMDGTGFLGTGLFTGGLNPSTWGAGEYAAVLVGGYVLYSVFSTGRRHAGVLRRKARAAYTTNPRRRRNVERGFYDATGFHPLRRSRDYDEDRAGDDYGSRSDRKGYGKRKR